MLNSSRIAVHDTDSDGNRHFNQTETDAANDKKREVTEAFDEWIFKDADRRKTLTQLFNDKFNTRVNRQYDGSHLTFPGKVPDQIISLRRGRRTPFGAGSSKTPFSTIMRLERKDLHGNRQSHGAAPHGAVEKKPMVVVPNHMVTEWATQAYRPYPGAKILPPARRICRPRTGRLFAKIASGDWDLVIVPHSSFQFIPISRATEERFLNRELEIANAALKEAGRRCRPKFTLQAVVGEGRRGLGQEDRGASGQGAEQDRQATCC